MAIFIASDLHLGHDKPFLYEPRGFQSIEQHDSEIIANWNNLISPEDTIYILGDVMLGSNEAGLRKLSLLNGNLKLIRGNHDTDTRWSLYETLNNIEVLGWAHMLKYRKYHFYLSHYPTITSNYDIDKPLKQRVINLCGHSHTKDKYTDMDKGLIYHCELDAHENVPILLDNIIEDIRKVFEKPSV